MHQKTHTKKRSGGMVVALNGIYDPEHPFFAYIEFAITPSSSPDCKNWDIQLSDGVDKEQITTIPLDAEEYEELQDHKRLSVYKKTKKQDNCIVELFAIFKNCGG